MHPTAHRPHRVLPAVAAALLLVGAAAAPASARPDRGETRLIQVGTSPTHCLLERVGSQFVRCDDLTGNGVPAPAWVPEF